MIELKAQPHLGLASNLYVLGRHSENTLEIMSTGVKCIRNFQHQANALGIIST